MSTHSPDPSVSRRSFLAAGSAAALTGSVLASCASSSSSGSGAAANTLVIPANANRGVSTFILPPLPWKSDELEPVISANTLSFHYAKHHKAYVDSLNKLVAEKSAYQGMSLVDIVKASAKNPADSGVFNNAAQAWNHTFYWNSLKPEAGAPNGALLDRLKADFGGVDECKQQLADAAKGQFGSGWAWLVTDGSKLSVVKTSNADNPITDGKKPLLVIDVWEHAYYLDHQNKRGDYVSGVMDKLLNWDFAADNLG